MGDETSWSLRLMGRNENEGVCSDLVEQKWTSKAGTSLRLGHLRFWALSYHHEDRNPLTGSPATAGSPSSPKGPRGRGLLLSWTGGEAWFIHRTTWMTLVATTDSILGGVASGDRKGRSGKDKPNGLNVLIINNISYGWQKQTQARYVSRYQQLRAK